MGSPPRSPSDPTLPLAAVDGNSSYTSCPSIRITNTAAVIHDISSTTRQKQPHEFVKEAGRKKKRRKSKTKALAPRDNGVLMEQSRVSVQEAGRKKNKKKKRLSRQTKADNPLDNGMLVGFEEKQSFYWLFVYQRFIGYVLIAYLLHMTAASIHSLFRIPSQSDSPRGNGFVKGEGAFSVLVSLEFGRRYRLTNGRLPAWEEYRHRLECIPPHELLVLERRYRAWYARTGGVLIDLLQPSV